MDINHLHLAVKEVERSKKFYEKCFQFQEKAWHGKMLFMENKEGFMLALDPNYEPLPLPPWFHFGLSLSSAQLVKDLYQTVKETGVKIPKPLEEYDDFVFFHCHDLDGYRIEIYWEG